MPHGASQRSPDGACWSIEGCMTPRTDASPSDARPPEPRAAGGSPGNTGCRQSTWLETRELGSRLATNAIARRLVAVPAESLKAGPTLPRFAVVQFPPPGAAAPAVDHELTGGFTNHRHPDRPLGAGLGLLLRHPRGQEQKRRRLGRSGDEPAFSPAVRRRLVAFQSSSVRWSDYLDGETAANSPLREAANDG